MPSNIEILREALAMEFILRCLRVAPGAIQDEYCRATPLPLQLLNTTGLFDGSAIGLMLK